MKIDAVMRTSIAIKLLLIGCIYSIVIRAQRLLQVDVQPRELLVREGDEFQFVCRAGRPIDTCRIEMPSGRVASLVPNVQITDFEYFGAGLQSGHCGLRVFQANTTHSGIFKCLMKSAESEDDIQGQMKLIVAVAPETPDLRLYKRNQLYNVGDIFQATCVVRNGRPVANISWYFGDELVYSGLQTPQVTSEKDLQTVSQNFIGPHFNEQKPITLNGFKEGQEGLITYTVQANPQPKMRWYVNGRDVDQKLQADGKHVYVSNESLQMFSVKNSD
ncbi:hypothetical protein B566_EDAN007453 [Ephemera danica]|nr:hypothetical protein B566_EDAN007453 [Ephemera danica]